MRLAGGAALALIGATAVRPAEAGYQAGYVAQFQGANLSNSGFIPPDMGGAVGNGYVLQMLNGAVSTYATSGTLVGSRQSLNAFWSGAGLGTAIGGTSVSDPRVIFDPSSGHWFASSISTQGTNNNILVAVSRTSDPTQGFVGYAIPAAGNNFADFPTLGVNNSAVTIGTNNFTSSTGSLVGSSVYSISKSALIDSIGSAQPPSVTRFDNTSGVGFTPQAVSNLTGTGTTTTLLSSNTATTFNV
ncbi:MAG TPA: hypothetical protein VFN42_01680, partial [Acetobacteraceae bacterium]|nr:hypothetical protein [Acetobacteraceae bacterium]